MLIRELERGSSKQQDYTIAFARNWEEVREAQRLRYRVFAEELGARLSCSSGIDEDEFDPYCKHLLVRDERRGEVVGTYRLLAPDAAARIGRIYCDQEFDLSRLAHLRPTLAEVGRSCIHPAFRSGSVIALLWFGLADYVQRSGFGYLVGCASMGMADGGANAAAVYRKLSQTSIAPPEYRVFPRNPLPLRKAEPTAQVAVPPLIKGYMRLGAYICGEPAWDPDFNTADLLVLLPIARIVERYARHFLVEARARSAAQAA